MFRWLKNLTKKKDKKKDTKKETKKEEKEEKDENEPKRILLLGSNFYSDFF